MGEVWDPKPGDRVQLKPHMSGHRRFGKQGTIANAEDQAVRTFGNEWRVIWDAALQDEWSQGRGFYLQEDLELIT